jgi:hypothetical protein
VAWDSEESCVITPRLSPTDLPTGHAYTLEPGRPTPGPPNLLRPPIALHKGTGLLTCFPSTTPFGLALGADSPCADERCAGNLGLSASGPFTRFIATHVSIRTSDTSSRVHPHLQRPTERSPTICAFPFEFIHLPDSTSLGDALSALRADSFSLRMNLKWNAHIRDFGAQFEPRYIFRAGRLDQ